MLTKINGRLQFYNRVLEIRKLRRGHYMVMMPYGTFEISGGRSAGGGKNDWFVEPVDGRTVLGSKPFFVRSLLAGLHLLDNA